MHGYDTYDIVWRQYYPAIGRFQTPDPEVESYFSLSPYTMCADNMVRYTDPDGRFIPLLIAVIVEAPEIYLLGAAAFVSITASIHHYQNQHQSSTYRYESNNQQSSNSDNTQAKANTKANNAKATAATPAPKNQNDNKKTNPKKEAREAAKEKRDNQPASEKYTKDKAKAKGKAEGPDARRKAQDEKGKGEPDRSKKQIDEDYKIKK